jgi:hypothetical protein
MLTIDVHNLSTGTDESANYEYFVSVNYKVIAKGVFSGHNRKDGWEVLVRDICQNEINYKIKENPNDS